jgi:ZIP family zinc transporter
LFVSNIGTLLGDIFLWATHRYFSYRRYLKQPEGNDWENLKGIWLFIIAIAIHNFPEGLAVGIGFVGIGLQNLPEGLAVTLALITENYSKSRAFWVALSTGLLEPVDGLVGAGIISPGQVILPWGMSFAAGAMLLVICDRLATR